MRRNVGLPAETTQGLAQAGSHTGSVTRLWFRSGHILFGVLLAILASYSSFRIASIQLDHFLPLEIDSQMIASASKLNGQFGNSAIIRANPKVTAINGKRVTTKEEFRRELRASKSSVLDLKFETLELSGGPPRLLWVTGFHVPPVFVTSDLGLVSFGGLDAEGLSIPDGHRVTNIRDFVVTTKDEVESSWDGSFRWNWIELRNASGEDPIEVFFWEARPQSWWNLLLLGIIFAGLGFSVHRLASDTRRAWAYLWFCLAASAYYLLRAIPSENRTFMEQELFVTYLCFLLVPGTYFCAAFSPIETIKKHSRRLLLGGLFYAILLRTIAFVGNLDLFLALWGGSNLLLLSTLVIKKIPFLPTSEPLSVSESQRLKITRIAMFASFLPPILFMIFAILAERASWFPISEDNLPPRMWFEATALIFPILVGYTVLRRNLLQVNELAIEGAVFGLGLAVIGVTFFMAVTLAVPLAERAFAGSTPWVLGAIAGLTAWLGVPIYYRARSRLEARYDRVFRAYDDLSGSLQSLGEDSRSPAAFLQTVQKRLERISQSRAVGLLTSGEEHLAPPLEAKIFAPGLISENVVHWRALVFFLRKVEGPVSRDQLSDSIMGEEGARSGLEAMRALGVIWVFPIVIEHRLAGLVALGEKIDYSNFSRSEISKIEAVSKECSFALYGFLVRFRMEEKLRAEFALQKAEQRVQQIIENVSDVIFSIRRLPSLKVEYISPHIEEITGFDCHEFYQNPELFMELIVPDDRDRFAQTLRNVGESWTIVEFRWQSKPGDPVWIEAKLAAVATGEAGDQRVQGIARDISERKNAELLEEKLRHAQKLQAVGTLAEGMAHDFGNLSNAILNLMAVAKDSLPHEHPAFRTLLEVERAAGHARSITRSLLLFSERGTTAKTPLELSGFLGQNVELLRGLIRNSIEIQLLVSPSEDVWIEADESQMQRVMLNLALNAQDAVIDRGTIRIRLKAEKGISHSESNEKCDYAVLVIEDNGVGIVPESIERIFEPFYSTKSPDQGTGLGLAVVYGIVSDFDGTIHVSSELGEGTRFEIRFPICSAPIVAQIGEEGPVADDLSRSVLVLSDFQFSRRMLVTSLKASGFETFQASSADEVRDLFANKPAGIDLLIIDGEKSFRMVTEEFEEAPLFSKSSKVLFITEESDPIPKQLLNCGACILEKPITLKSFVAQVHCLIGSGRLEQNGAH